MFSSHGRGGGRTLTESDTRVPLIIRDPDLPQSFGTYVPIIVENVDIMPTMIDLADLPDPEGRLWPPLEGR